MMRVMIMKYKHLQLKIKGEKVQKGRIPLNVFQKILSGIQTAIYQVGEYHYTKSATRERGRYPKDVIEQCTLELVSIDKGSFIANLELPSETQPSLFPTLGEQSLETFIHFLDNLSTENDTSFEDIKEKSTVQKILRTMQDILPRTDEYSLQISSTNKYIPSLSFKTAKKIDKLLREPNIFERELIGQIVEMRIVEDRYFGLLNKERIIRCYFSEDLENEVIESIGKDVRITGEALVNENDKIVSLRKVTDIRVIETGFWTVEKIRWQNKIYKLMESLTLDIDYKQNYWILKCNELDIEELDERFENVLNAFYEDFSMLWEEYALENDDNLSIDAVELKNKILNLVERVEE